MMTAPINVDIAASTQKMMEVGLLAATEALHKVLRRAGRKAHPNRNEARDDGPIAARCNLKIARAQPWLFGSARAAAKNAMSISGCSPAKLSASSSTPASASSM